MTTAWSYGGGIQSVAIGVLIRQGALPVPDLAAIADTSRERRTTWQYLHEHMQPYLEPTGLKIEIADHSFARVDLYDRDGTTLMPAFTTEGRLGAFCSGEWKRDAMNRWLRSKGVERCDTWIGYSLDELHRISKDRKKWNNYEYPLIDKMLNRAMCAALIEAAGLPLPRKSRCWSCPHQTEAEWQETLADPVDGPKAIALDREVRERDPQGKGLWLYSGRVPLEMATFGGDGGLAPPSRSCETGHCWT